MKLNLKNLPPSADIIRHMRTAAIRFALREVGSLLRVSAPFIERAGEKLQALGDDTPRSAPVPPPPSQYPSSFDF